MNKAIKHLRGNAIAYLALFVALGGTSYAAISVPRNSVGTRQLKNGAVTPAKLNSGMIGASVRAWAEITPTGFVQASSGGAHTAQWNSPIVGSGTLSFSRSYPTRCFALANVGGFPGAEGSFQDGTALATYASSHAFIVRTYATDGALTPLPVLVVVLCPS